MQMAIGWRAALCAVVVMQIWPAVRLAAEEAAPARTGGGIARPSVEELAVPRRRSQRTRPREQYQRGNVPDDQVGGEANGLPLEFFARVIWQESRFQSDAVGPMTRSGERAQGIAQFMPGTARASVGCSIPSTPVQALPKSAEFLSELRAQFGNLGLAAAAYNAGPRRVQEWLAGSGYMPQETRNYVAAITGSTVDDWAAAGRKRQDAGARADRRLPRTDGIAQARAQSLCHRARTACEAWCCQAMGCAARRRASIATRRWRCMPAR